MVQVWLYRYFEKCLGLGFSEECVPSTFLPPLKKAATVHLSPNKMQEKKKVFYIISSSTVHVLCIHENSGHRD